MKHATLYDTMPCPVTIPQEVWESHHRAFGERMFVKAWREHVTMVSGYARDAKGNFMKDEKGNWIRI